MLHFFQILNEIQHHLLPWSVAISACQPECVYRLSHIYTYTCLYFQDITNRNVQDYPESCGNDIPIVGNCTLHISPDNIILLRVNDCGAVNVNNPH